jgi:hypothetical protein
VALRVSLHLRPPGNKTNFRSECIAEGLRQAGAIVTVRSREQSPAWHADLVLQSGLAGTPALQWALDRGVPYLIAELPSYRHVGDMDVSYGYGGLMGGAFHTPAPSEELWKPTLKPMKTDGPTIIVGQKPNDHSLRGHDHDKWLQEKLIQFPNAEFRAHPLMVPSDALYEPVRDVLARAGRLVTYTSSMGNEGLIEGCAVNCSPYCQAYDVKNREEWLHKLSWHNFPFDAAATAKIGKHVLKGYEVARIRADQGQQEIPRAKSTRYISSYNVDDPRVT